jgi:16S rRNA processing protein RimM
MHFEDFNWTIGVVTAPFGTRGEMKVRYETDFPERFKKLKKVCLRSPRGQAGIFEVTGVREHKGQALIKLYGVDRIEEVEPWRQARVQIPRVEAVTLPAGEYYTADILGFEVCTVDGRKLGKLERILPYPAYDLWVVGEAMIPSVKEIVKQVNTNDKRIVVDPPAGMLPGEEPEDAD